MRDFRDAKVMAHALRDALRMKAVETTHSECLELIAKVLGYDNWNVLAAKIEEAERRNPSDTTLYCSFCGKSQHEVRKLIAGPTVFICDECVSLCDDIIDHEDDQEILGLLKADAERGNQVYPNALEYLRRMSTEDIASFVTRCRIAAERNRSSLQLIQGILAMRDGKVVADREMLSSPRFAHLRDKPREALLALLEEGERRLERYDEALRIGVMVLEGRGQRN